MQKHVCTYIYIAFIDSCACQQAFLMSVVYCCSTFLHTGWATILPLFFFLFIFFFSPDSIDLLPFRLLLAFQYPPAPAGISETVKLHSALTHPHSHFMPRENRELCCYVMQDASSWLVYFTACLTTVSVVLSPHSVTVSNWIGVWNLFFPLSQRLPMCVNVIIYSHSEVCFGLKLMSFSSAWEETLMERLSTVKLWWTKM